MRHRIAQVVFGCLSLLGALAPAVLAADPPPCEKLAHSDATLRDPVVQRQLIASGVLNGEVGGVSQLDLRRALCIHRLVNGLMPEAPFSDADRAILKRASDEFQAWARLEQQQLYTRDMAAGPQFQTVLPVPVGALPQALLQDPNDLNRRFQTSFQAADRNAELNLYSYGVHRFTADLFLQQILKNKAAPTFYHLSLAKNALAVEGEDRRPDGSVQIFYHRVFVDGGRLKGFGLQASGAAPAGFTPLPALLRLSEAYANVPERLRDPNPSVTLDVRTQAWRRAHMALANLIGSDFERLNGRSEISTAPCQVRFGGPEPAGASRIRVIFGTDRTAIKSDRAATPPGSLIDPDSLFGPEPSGELHIGCAIVSTPRDIQDSRFLRYKPPTSSVTAAVMPPAPVTQPDRTKYFAIDHFAELKPDSGSFGDNISIVDRGPGASTGKALVFVHGYNVSFAEALARAAQIAQSAAYRGRVYLFSWPSRSKVQNYIGDLDYAEQSEVYFRAFLRGIMRDRSIRQFDFIAHSMGAQPMLRTLVELKDEFLASAEAVGVPGSEKNVEVGRHLGQVIFAAPDVGHTVFANRVRDLRPYADRITVYASATDRAMYAARKLRSNAPRAGDTAALELMRVPGIQLIDASRTLRWTDWRRYVDFGHSDFAERKDLITDIADLLAERWRRSDNTATPDLRRPARFKRVPADRSLPERYWIMAAE